MSDGADLERRAHQLAWHLGYFARRRVFVYTDERGLVTDIDVVGLKFDITLEPHLIIFETKSERGFSSIMKLKGLLDYYASKSAYIIRPNVTPDVVKFAHKLGVRAMHTSRLDEMEEEARIQSGGWPLTFTTEFDRNFIPLLKILREKGFVKEVLIRDTFWLEENPFYKAKILHEAITRLSRARNDVADNQLRFALACLILDLACLFGLSILEVSSVLYSLPEHQRKTVFRDMLVAGKLSKREKEELLDKFYTTLTRYAKEVFGTAVSMRKENFKLVPEYSVDDLYDLVCRYIKKARAAKEVPRLLDVYLATYVLGRELNFAEVQKFLSISEEDFKLSLKFSRDLLTFLFGEKIPDLCVPLFKE